MASTTCTSNCPGMEAALHQVSSTATTRARQDPWLIIREYKGRTSIQVVLLGGAEAEERRQRHRGGKGPCWATCTRNAETVRLSVFVTKTP